MGHVGGSPAAVDRVLAADELDVRWLAGVVGRQRALHGGDHVPRLGDPLGVETQLGCHPRHVQVLRPQHPVRVWVVAVAPEPGAVAGETAVADVGHRDADVLTHGYFQIAQHVADAGIAGYRDALPLGEGQLCREGSCQSETQRGDVAPAQEPPGDQRVVHRAELVARVAGVVGDEGIVRIQRLHKVAIHAVRIDRRVV